MNPDSAILLLLVELRQRIAALEAENAQLRQTSQDQDGDPHRT